MNIHGTVCHHFNTHYTKYLTQLRINLNVLNQNYIKCRNKIYLCSIMDCSGTNIIIKMGNINYVLQQYNFLNMLQILKSCI